MSRLRHDLNFLSSVGLVVTGVATALSGLLADLWDLNDFWYHTVSGYVMGGFAVAHVWLNWDRLVAYARFRLARRPPREAAIVRSVALDPTSNRDDQEERTGPAARLVRLALSRRGLFKLGVAGVGGWVLGRGLRPAPPLELGSDVGVIYHQWSKPGLIDALGTVANWGLPPELYKAYPGARTLALPPPSVEGGPPASEAIHRRRSTRAYADRSMTLAELSRVLHLTNGLTADRWGNARRAAPSSGALYPIEVYAVVHRVDGVEPGVYHYAYRQHALEQVRAGDFRKHVVEQGIGQEFLGQCAVVLFLTMILQRMRPKYQDRSYRYGLLEAGHIGENAYLAAASTGLGACGIGAFMDDQMNEMLGVDGVEEAAVYMLAIGHPAGAIA